MTIIGLDVGNSNIVIAIVKDSILNVLMDPQGKRQIPSIVSFMDHERRFGSLGAPFLSINPEATIYNIKRLIGRSFRDEDIQDDIKVLPFRTIEGPRGEILIKVDYLDAEWIFSPVEILAMLLKHAKDICQTNMKEVINRCVISIPSYFTNLQRRLYLDAASIAGLSVSLLHDGTAIALGYGLRNTCLAANVLFVDVGQSDCQVKVTVAEFQSGQLKILSHTFDQSLGGKDFDAVLYKHFAEEIMRDYNFDIEMSVSGSIRLRASCEKLKINLGAKTECGFIVKHLIKNQDIRCFVRRDRFDELTSELVKRITLLCSKALEESGLSIERITTIELVGSGSRIPAIAEGINRVLKKKPVRTLHASEAVARGCVLYGSMLTSQAPYKVMDRFPYTIELRVKDPNIEPPKPPKPPKRSYINSILKKNTNLEEPKNTEEPVRIIFSKGSQHPSSLLISRTVSGRSSVDLNISYTKEDFPAARVLPSVGRFNIKIPHAAETLKVKVKIGSSGILEITSAEVDSQTVLVSDNAEISVTVEEFNKAKQTEHTLSDREQQVDRLKQERNLLETFVNSARTKLQRGYKAFASDEEYEQLNNALILIDEWLYEAGDDVHSEEELHQKLNNLETLWQPLETRWKDNHKMVGSTSLLALIKSSYDRFIFSLWYLQ